MDVVILAEMILEQMTIPGNCIEAEEGFSSCYASTKGTHTLRFLKYL
jgi:hypothetical protein